MKAAEKYIEECLSRIGSKVVKATEMTFTAKKLIEKSNCLMFETQTEIADLYECLGELFQENDATKKDVPVETVPNELE